MRRRTRRATGCERTDLAAFLDGASGVPHAVELLSHEAHDEHRVSVHDLITQRGMEKNKDKSSH